MASLMTDAQRALLVRRVRVEMARRGLTREALAGRADCKERTLGNLLAGQAVRDQTVAKVARALGIDLYELMAADTTPVAGAAGTGHAAASYGGYPLSAFENYLGAYVAYRRALSHSDELYRSVYEIDWDEDLARLRFFELQRYRKPASGPISSSHAGGIYISPHTGMLQMLTTFQGALRLVTLSRFRLGEQRLRGVILTQSEHDGNYQPAASAIFLDKIDGRRPSAELEKLIGPVGPHSADHTWATAELTRIEGATLHFGAPPRRDR